MRTVFDNEKNVHNVDAVGNKNIVNSKIADISNMSDEHLIETGFDNSGVMTEIILRNTSLVTAIARNLTRGNIHFEDMVSEGFLGLMNAVKTFDSSKGGFRAFAAKCISNKIKSALRKTANEDIDDNIDIPELAGSDFSPEELVIFKERSSEIKKALINLLSEREFSVLILFTANHSYTSIAKKLELDEKAVDNALQRARKKLKKYFGG